VYKMRNGSNSAWITVGLLDPAGFQVGGITPIANGGTGAITAALALAALLPSQAGNAGKALVTSGSVASWTTINGITSGTAVASTSGTSVDFIGIPAGVKRITVMFNGVSTSGTSNLLVQLGAGSVTTTGYASSGATLTGGSSVTSSSAGFLIGGAAGADVRSGHVLVSLVSGNIWVSSHSMTAASTTTLCGGGNVTLSSTLDRIRITTVNGTDTFDAGSINILYES
jgi:hypothetical protein